MDASPALPHERNVDARYGRAVRGYVCHRFHPFVLFVGVILALAGHLAGPGTLTAQQRVELGATRACEACEIELKKVVTLGDREGEGYVGFPVGIGRMNTGEWLLVQAEHLTQIAVFGPDGRFIRRVGRFGGGPGEFRQIMSLNAGSGDSVRLYDPLNGRLTVLDRNLEYRRGLQLGITPPSHFVFGSDGGFITSVALNGVERLGYPLHAFGPDGSYLRSFGAIRPAYRAGDTHRNSRSIAAGPGGGVLSAHLLAYRVELWSAAGDLLRTYERQADWFEPHDHFGFNGDQPPNPGLASIHLDAEGRLWTILSVADPEWRNGVGPVKHPYGHTITRITDYTAYFDTIIEVFDLETGSLLASRRFPEYLHRFNDQGLLYGYREDSAGYPFVDVYRVQLRPGG